jgi:periplasmic protein TonB
MNRQTAPLPALPPSRETHLRLVWVLVVVLVAHGAALWSVHRLDRPPPPTPVTPAEILVEVMLALAPQHSTSVPVPTPPPTAPNPLPLATPLPTPQPASQPVRLALPTTPALAPAPVETAASPISPTEPGNMAAGPTSATPVTLVTPAASTPDVAVATNASALPATPAQTSPTPARIELPSSQAEYLNNPPPPYPRLSRRLGEQGKVVVRVLIGTNGQAEQAQIHTSSGHERLDQTALTTVLGWRFVPGKRNGMAEAMWFNVPIQFVLE